MARVVFENSRGSRSNAKATGKSARRASTNRTANSSRRATASSTGSLSNLRSTLTTRERTEQGTRGSLTGLARTRAETGRARTRTLTRLGGSLSTSTRESAELTSKFLRIGLRRTVLRTTGRTGFGSPDSTLTVVSHSLVMTRRSRSSPDGMAVRGTAMGATIGGLTSTGGRLLSAKARSKNEAKSRFKNAKDSNGPNRRSCGGGCPSLWSAPGNC